MEINFKMSEKIIKGTFLTHDNGGTPFKVIIDEKKVLVYENETCKFLFEFFPKDVFVGKRYLFFTFFFTLKKKSVN